MVQEQKKKKRNTENNIVIWIVFFWALGWGRLYYQILEQKSLLTLHYMTSDYPRSRFVYCDNVSAYCLRNTENK